jgi:hypothetical protein
MDQMKKTTIALTILTGVTLVGVIGAASAFSAFAQSDAQAPTATPQPSATNGLGRMWGTLTDGEGPLHDYIIAAFADTLGIAPSELETRLEAGETLSAIALDEGYTLDEFRTLFAEARQAAIGNAQQDGVVIQDQLRTMQRLAIGAGPNGECPMLGDTSGARSGYGGMGMLGNRGGAGNSQR